jgi:hypothetical protein
MLTEFDFGLLVLQAESKRQRVVDSPEWEGRLGFCLQAEGDFRILVATGNSSGWAEVDWLNAVFSELNSLRLAELHPALEIPEWRDCIVVDGRFSPPLPSGPKRYAPVSRAYIQNLLGQYFSRITNRYLQG